MGDLLFSTILHATKEASHHSTAVRRWSGPERHVEMTGRIPWTKKMARKSFSCR